MIRKFLFFSTLALLTLAQFFGLQRCATPSPPNGGPVDSVGPVLVLEESTPNFQTNFRPDRIELTFDEWVELDPQQEILISPPIELEGDNRPTLRRRTLLIPLEGVTLRDSVTYVVNIGGAIKDLNEGNPTENLRFVFATGPVLDTASVTGTVVDAFTGEPLDEIAVTLYSDLADTAVFTQNPTYFAQTDAAGTYTISNVRPGRYRVVALQRNPAARSYYADYTGVFPPLAVGFLDSLITVTDGENALEALRLSPVPISPRIVEADLEEYGVIKLTLNQAAGGVDLSASRTYRRNNFGDTLLLFYRQPGPDTLLVGRRGIEADTLIVTGEEASVDDALPLALINRTKGKVNPGEGIRLVFNRPVDSLDTARVRLYRDTLPAPVAFSYSIDSLYPAEVRLRASWSGAVPFRLEVLPGAVSDWYGIQNRDSIVADLNVDSGELYGDLVIYFTNLNPTIDYIVRLIDGNDQVVLGSRRYIDEQFEYVAEYKSLRPATYRMELIYDSNGNERYDVGDLRFGLQPETVQRFEIEPLRANWTVEKTIDL
ncbi:carboxypeptidase regulatory-like domain-containing protein [Neolewinella litorea]|uniref:SbsA Ig-like domain-containing protein n=1 Tax=Neolewinella litorea TaxID=2562452 RepID=A0A4S4NPR0_9BACT|nr:carboxypeptidase regulatory-like domain-containing protein [Neolewinella litorea]THH42046.1 hypothetical protein E4021_05550 [Neolewinella litorea]